MRVLIAGVGDTGSYIARYLIEENFDVTIIDIDISKVRQMSDNEAVAGVIGDVLTPETLHTAGIYDTDIFIACTHSDEVNILACQMASNFGVKYNICSLKSSKYDNEHWKKIFNKKIDDFIDLDNSITNSILNQIQYRYLNISNVLKFYNDDIKMFSIKCTEDCIANKRTISSIYESSNKKLNFKIVGLQKNNNYFIPTEDDIIQENDEIFIISQEKDIIDMYSLFFEIEQTESKFLDNQSPNIVIAGNHPFIKILAENLSKYYNKIKVVLDNKNESKNTLMAMDLEKFGIQVISDDITKEEYRNNYLKSEDDIIIILNKNDNDNILKALMLKYQKVGNIFCYLNNDSNKNFLTNSNIDHIITPSFYIISPILSYIRRGVILQAYSINRNAEVLELVANENSKIIGKKVHEIEKDGKCSIAIMLDKKSNIIPFDSDTVIIPQYQIILVVIRKYIPTLEEDFLQQIDCNS